MSTPFTDTLASIPADKPSLTVPIGVTPTGTLTCLDLAKAPHALYAGVTGSGKSVGLNVAISTIMARNTPENVRFRMVDPKRVELSAYRTSAFVDVVVTDMDLAADLVEELVGEMDRRYSLLEDHGVRSLADYNALGVGEHEPLIVLVVDELADLMDTHQKVVLPHLIRLGQLARAAGIHMLMATQRPAADTIPKRLLSNVPTRVGYRTQSHTESRLILNEKGAEALNGNGDLLALMPEVSGLIRAQCPFIEDSEIAEVVALHHVDEITDEEAELEEVELDEPEDDEFDEPELVEEVEEVEEVEPPRVAPSEPVRTVPDGETIAAIVAEVSTQTRAASQAEVDRLLGQVRDLGADNDRLYTENTRLSVELADLREKSRDLNMTMQALDQARIERDEDAAVLRAMRRNSEGIAARQSVRMLVGMLIVMVLTVAAVITPGIIIVAALAAVVLTGATAWQAVSNLANATPRDPKKDWENAR